MEGATLTWPSELLAQRTVPCDSVRGNEQDSVSETPGDTPFPLAAWDLTSWSTVPHTWLTIAPNPCFTPPVTSQGLLPCQCFESSPEQLEVTLGRGQTDAYETLLFALQTKKYADVIIPRGVDNMVAINLIVQHIQDILNGDICKWHRGGSNGRSYKRTFPEPDHPGMLTAGKRSHLESSSRPH